MNSIRKYSISVVNATVPDSKGVYILGNYIKGSFVVGYVGRSDNSLKRRLASHNHKGKFQYFTYKEVKTMREGFLLETELWYRYKNTIINKIHPQVPLSLWMEHPCDTLGRILKKKFMRCN